MRSSVISTPTLHSILHLNRVDVGIINVKRLRSNVPNKSFLRVQQHSPQTLMWRVYRVFSPSRKDRRTLSRLTGDWDLAKFELDPRCHI